MRKEEIVINETAFIFDELRNADRATQLSKLSPEQKRAISAYNERLMSDSTKFEWSPCLCGNTDRLDLIATTDRHGFYQNTVSCRSCGLIFCNPRMTPGEAAHFYQSDTYRQVYDGMNYVAESQERYEASSSTEILHLVEKAMKVGPGIGVAEVGAGGGWNLLPFAKRGAIVSGIEHSPTLVELGNRRGLNLTAGGLENLTGHYDLIIINHVLEHTHDPVSVLRKLGGHLTAKGMIYVGVPNILHFDLSQFQNAHLYCFAPKNFRYYCNQAGFKVSQFGSAHEIHMYAILSVSDGDLATPSLNHCSVEVYDLLRKQRMRRKIGALLKRIGLKKS